MTKPMEIDFAVDVPDEAAGEAVATSAKAAGYRVKVVFDPGEEGIEDDPPSWTCYCTRDMVPDYDAVVAVQAELDEISRPFGGHSDGWGTFGNAEDN